jgi:hypothetical protein
MLNRRFVLTLVAVAAMLTAATSQATGQFAPLTSVNNLTFETPVALPGITLPAGTYVFERDSVDNSRIVRVKSPNYQKLLFVGFTMPVTRPRSYKSPVSFGEAAAGEPIPIIAWYPVGSDRGHQFLYR